MADKEAVALLETRARDERARGGAAAAYHTALFYALVGDWDRAREFLDKATGVSALVSSHFPFRFPARSPVPGFQYSALRGWAELKSGRDMKGALKAFEDAIASGERVIDAWLGKAHYHHLRQNSQAMIEALDNVHLPPWLPALRGESGCRGRRCR